MKKLSEIESMVDGILATSWQKRDGKVVPDADSVKLGNDAVELDATVLYADLVDSTGLVTGYKDWFAAEVYKCFLSSACEIIKNNGGVITAFDGDRVMAVYIGDSKNSSAAKTALQINWVVKNLINPKIKGRYEKTSYSIQHAVGIDSGKLLVAKTGIFGFNDLVWVGRAANVAAKLSAHRDGSHSSFISRSVYNKLSEATKFGADKKPMWTESTWSETGEAIYKSTWWWKPA